MFFVKTRRKYFKATQKQSKIEFFKKKCNLVGKTREDGPKNTLKNPKPQKPAKIKHCHLPNPHCIDAHAFETENQQQYIPVVCLEW